MEKRANEPGRRWDRRLQATSALPHIGTGVTLRREATAGTPRPPGRPIADQYRPPGFALALGLFGHRDVIQDPEFVIVGGAGGTQAEIDLALSMGKKIITLPGSGALPGASTIKQTETAACVPGWPTSTSPPSTHATTPEKDFVRTRPSRTAPRSREANSAAPT
ncbi:MAG: hypothetical protein ACRDOO_23620 [Actinomadura sp.]